MVCLVVALEGFEARHEGALIGDGMLMSWREGRQAAVRQARRAEVLCLGDSLVQLGVLPPVISARTGWSSYNLALPGAPSEASYYLLRRVLAQGARPRAVVVDFHANNLTTPPRLTTRFWPELLDFAEAADLGWHARDHQLVASTWLGLLLPTVRRRDDLREELQAALRGSPRSRRAAVAAALRNLRAHGGADPQPRRTPRPDLSPAIPRREWAPYPVNARYVRRFLDLAAAQRIPVFWLVPPLSPARQARYEQRGVDEGYTRFIRAVRAEYPAVTVLDARRCGYRAGTFIDPTHLDSQGAAELSANVADVIAARTAGERSDPGWVDLPPYRGGEAPPVSPVGEDATALAKRARSRSAR